MGVTRTDLYTQEQTELANLAKAIGHPARIAILDHLSEVDGCICGSLVDKIGLAQATISQHLKELKNIGLIKGEVSGTRVCYCIDKNNWKKCKSMITSFLDKGLKCCC